MLHSSWRYRLLRQVNLFFVEIDADMYQKPARAEQSFPVVSACIRTGNTDILLSDGSSEEFPIRIIKAVRSC